MLDAGPDVLNHNTETVPRLYRLARPGGRYPRSLELLDRARTIAPHIPTKTGLIVGLGEEWDELVQTLEDLRASGVEILTIGQYLRPTESHLRMVRYYHPDEFAELKRIALDLGLRPRRVRTAGPQFVSCPRAGGRACRRARLTLTLLPHHGPTPALAAVHRAIVSCERCPRLRRYCQRIAVEKRAAFRDQIYWGRPVPGFGDPAARLLIVGLAPAAHGANRTGRVFTGDGVGGSGDFLLRGDARQRLRQQADLASRRRRARAARRVHRGGRPLRAAGQQAHAEEFGALPAAPAGRVGRAAERHGGALPRQAGLGRLLARAGRCAAIRCRGRARSSRTARACRLDDGFAVLGAYHPSRQNTHTGRLTPQMLADAFAKARREIED